MSSPEIELLIDRHATIGESPTWSATEQALYWIDVKQPALHRLDEDGNQQHWQFDADIGAFALVDGGAVLALRTGLFRLDFAGGTLTPLAAAPFDTTLFRFNEGICDARGRFWVGVMRDPLPGRGIESERSPQTAPLHRFTFESGLVPAQDRSDLHNGMAWSADGRMLYLTHSNQGSIYRYEYDLDKGTLGLRQPYVTTHDGSSVPDGAAMDQEGCYWCAIHGAGVLRRYNPGGRMIAEVALPVSQPTMCAFTGKDLDVLVVTSAADKLTPEQHRREPHAGGLFRLRPGIHGIPRPCIVR